MQTDSDNSDKWINFLDPDRLKENLISASLYIAFFEAFKDYLVEEIKSFYLTGFSDNEYIFSNDYDMEVKSKDKSIVKASLLWLLEMKAITEADINLFDQLLKYRNKLSHELISLLFEGLENELPENLMQLITLRTQIEKWWILNIEIPTNPDFTAYDDVSEQDITTSTQMITKIIFEMLSGDKEKSRFYQNELIKRLKVNP